MEPPPNLINLTGMPLDVVTKIQVDEENEYDKIKADLLMKQLELCKVNFQKLLKQRNRSLIRSIEQCIKSSLNESLFVGNKSLHAIAIILGMHVSDHSPTLEAIEDSIEANFSEIHLKASRLTPSVMKYKRTTDSFLSTQVSEHKNIVLVIEQVQKIDRLSLDYLLDQLMIINSGPEPRNIILIFCLATNKPSLNHILTADRQKMLKPVPILTWDNCEASSEIQQILLDDENISVKLGPQMISLLCDQFIYKDASVASTHFLYSYGLIDHYDHEASFITDLIKSKTLSKKYIDRAIDQVKQLESIADDSEFAKVDWNCKKDVRRLVTSKLKYLLSYHKYIISQVYYFYYLLRDETGNNFPSDLNDLYDEVMKCKNIGESRELYDSIERFGQIKQNDRVLARLERCINNQRSLPQDMSQVDMISLIQKFARKLRSKMEEEIIIDSDVTCAALQKNTSKPFKIVINKLECKVGRKSRGKIAVNGPPSQSPCNISLDIYEGRMSNSLGEQLVLRSRLSKEKQSFESKRQLFEDNRREEIAKILREFCESLHNHATIITSPLDKALSELIYYDYTEIVKTHCIPDSRYTFRLDLIDPRKGSLRCKCCKGETLKRGSDEADSLDDNQQTDVCRLYNILHEENEDVSIYDLYQLFRDQIMATIPKINPELKTAEDRPKKKSSRGGQDTIIKSDRKKEVDTDLLKARFANSIHDLEIHGLVKRCTNISKRDILQRVIWL